MEHKLSYRNEDDKCYGATGMAIAVVVFDGEDMLSAVNLDATPDNVLELSEEFYFAGNPGLSAKSAWNRILSNFNLTMATSIANVMCRKVVLDNEAVDAEIKRFLRDFMLDEGKSTCDLDEEETARLFDKNYTYLHRVFNHHGVQGIAHDFANVLKRRRRMTRMEVIEQLRALSML